MTRAGPHPAVGDHPAVAVFQPEDVPARGRRRRQRGATATIYRRLNGKVGDGRRGAPAGRLDQGARGHVARRRQPRVAFASRSRGRRSSRSPTTTTSTSSRPTRTASPTAPRGFVTKGWQVAVEGLVRQAEGLRPRRSAEDQPARGAGLPHALRRGVVDGDPVGGLLAGEAARAVEPLGDAKYVAFETLLDPEAHARPEDRRARLAVRRGAADGRGDAPADAAGVGPLRPRAAAAGRRAGAAGGAVEVRLQGHQVDRQDHARGDAAADDLEPAGARRIRLLRQREPAASITRAGARPPSSASANRAGGRPDVQRLRRSRSRSLYAGMDLRANF